MAAPRPPAELRASGRKLWRSVLGRYELEQHETQLLLEMCRTADNLDALAERVARDGVADAEDRIHPALIEARQQRIAFARLSAVLRLPSGDEGDMRRPQRRVGVRGTYGIRGLA